ncbi:serine/threonine-protein kinase [Streptomyces cadmiisoli]|uniref:non-specific serine/threonine protein kinase n=1 Tax=Streptomyces cadmiisoli TaxID=2184053 RepID=A0A2Z4J0L4_9ACTN|nr:serine/threonine-protein kinase [Streptomyces cadmiisoli]AWW38610.1 serine/threonine protein kinase [Streptomyces cadmiisoli]
MGEVFAGRYELVDPIGRGGVGAVWRAWDHRRRRYVAAKVLQQSDAHSLLRFVREQALRIDHPHVLAPASWAADDDKVLFTMDLVAGGSLVHLVGDYGPLPAPFVCTLLDQLLSGLAAVHAEEVVHRDIKPANVLLEATGTGRPKLRLSDFGIAMRLGEPRLTETNLVVGTPGYLAPEQMMGAEPDFPSDLFAVGLVALYLLEGAKPDAKVLVEYFAAHGTPRAPAGIPEPLWQVVAALLQPDPQARFRTATGARKALASAAELLATPGPDDEQIEIFDQLGPLPTGFAPEGPLTSATGVRPYSGTGTGGETVQPGAIGEATPTGAEDPAASSSLWPGTGSVRSGPHTPVGTPDPRHGHLTPPSNAPHAAPPAPHGAQSLPAESPTPARHPERSPSPDPAQPAAMSETGSFHLPPPQPTDTSAGQPTADPRQPQQPHQPQPQAQPPAAEHQGAPSPHPQRPFLVSPHDTTHVLPSPQPHAPPYPAPLPPRAMPRGADTSTASYTAQDRQVPPTAPPISHRPADEPGDRRPADRHSAGHRPEGNRSGRRRAGRRRAGRRHRPGPPAKVAFPLLLLALACYAVGFWALTRI